MAQLGKVPDAFSLGLLVTFENFASSSDSSPNGISIYERLREFCARFSFIKLPVVLLLLL